MSSIGTGIAELDSDLSRIQELLDRSDLDDLIEGGPKQLLKMLGRRAFALLVMLATDDRRSNLFEAASESSHEAMRSISEEVASKLGALLDSEEGEELKDSIFGGKALLQDDIYDAVRSISHSGFLLEISEGRLLPHIRANVFASERKKMATLTLEWDDCLFLCSSLISVLCNYMRSFNGLMEQQQLAVDATVLANRSDDVSRTLAELNELIGHYQELSTD